eukprot:CAMPEP_0185846856 /NCGR_PEP_ID=MMETSP1354-20130828/2344_1 /TAXON_ID=708628 /ORGANISM="Erythrolobus madagascarensis, Strain CCMP3276" /LENGTH=300 /DNA_ID=CAMNT_0028547065 /DNA_START=6 /DNA_END=908 /DNA_ORIENTATION=-
MAGRLIAGLRERCDEKEEELSELLTELRALEVAKDGRQKELGNLASKWDQGQLYSTEYEITNVVDVHGDMTVSGNYNKKHEEGFKPKPKTSGTVAPKKELGPGDRQFSAGKEEEYAGEFAVPEWAKNETKKMIKKETLASKDTKDVRIDSTKNELSTTKTEIKKDVIVDGSETAGKVSGARAMFSQMSQEEESRDDIKEKMRLKREARKKQEEEDKVNEEARKKKEKEEQELAAREAAEKKRMEEEAEKRRHQKVKVGRLPGVPDEEPADPAQLLEYFNKKKDALDEEICKVQNAIKNFA